MQCNVCNSFCMVQFADGQGRLFTSFSVFFSISATSSFQQHFSGSLISTIYCISLSWKLKEVASFSSRLDGFWISPINLLLASHYESVTSWFHFLVYAVKKMFHVHYIIWIIADNTVWDLNPVTETDLCPSDTRKVFQIYVSRIYLCI